MQSSLSSVKIASRRSPQKTITVHMIGNAHLDPVWLWNWQAGVDEALATFRSAADRCAEYPEFQYTRGEAWLYEMVARIDPILFRRVQRAIARKQWHVTGGQYVQPDANLPTEIGWKMQLRYGLEYFQKTFNKRPTVGYNVDTFGHPATLPDILREQGIQAYVFHRPSAKQQKLPAQIFRWRGLKGAEVMAFRITPCYVTRTDDLYGQIMSTLDECDPSLGHVMCFYGLGNHGGGPTKASIEYIIQNRSAFPNARLEFSDPERFFNAIQGNANRLPVFEGELQHTFPGCYSVMHEIKQSQHRTEYKLLQAENFLQSFEPSEKNRRGLAAPMRTAWKDLLFTQFHDILAGTSITTATPSIRAKQGRALATAEEVIVTTTRRWARQRLPGANLQQIVLMNSEPTPFSGLVQCEPFLDFGDWNGRWISTLEGRFVPFQHVTPCANMGPMTHAILFPVEIPAQGSTTLFLRDDSPPSGLNGKGKSSLKGGSTLKDDTVRIELGPQGVKLISWQETAILKNIGLQLREDKGDTWVFHSDKFEAEIVERLDGLQWKLEEGGPLRSRAYAEGRLGDTVVRWSVDLLHNRGKLVFHLDIHFRERYRLLQLRLPSCTSVKKWTVGLPGGWLDRKPSDVEWPVQKWVKAPSFGIVTPDAYSISHDDTGCSWTLLRSPLMAWSGEQAYESGTTVHHADQGVHRFEFEIHLKDIKPETLDRAHRFMVCPPVIFDRYEGMNRPAWRNHPPRRLWTPDISRARQDGRMMHLQDVDGSRHWEESPA